jgi:hypothetical protein
MNYLMATRFNNKTWEENVIWRERNEYKGCIYNSPIYIKETIPLEVILYIIEMNNNTNKILGFGKIINKNYSDRRYFIYSDRNYNRFTYKGKTRIDIKDIDEKYNEQIEKLENYLFKNKGHFKRGQGISQLPLDLTNKYFNLIKDLFIL